MRRLRSCLPSLLVTCCYETDCRVGHTVEPLIKDTLNKGHLCIKYSGTSDKGHSDASTHNYSTNTTFPKEDNLSIMVKIIPPNVSGKGVPHTHI